jgi:lipopolysaccharide export LptBFGC system permease protein LptF
MKDHAERESQRAKLEGQSLMTVVKEFDRTWASRVITSWRKKYQRDLLQSRNQKLRAMHNRIQWGRKLGQNRRELTRFIFIARVIHCWKRRR